MDPKRAARLHSLQGTSAWGELTEELQEAEERYWRALRAEFTAGKALDQRELDYMRGKLGAIRSLLNQPARANRVLEREEKAKEETSE